MLLIKSNKTVKLALSKGFYDVQNEKVPKKISNKE